jgi:hypothetical protein
LYYRLVKGRSRATKKTTASLLKDDRAAGPHLITVEDFKSPVPFTFSDRVRVSAPKKVQVVVGGTVRDEAQVTPENGDYRLMFVPQVGDIGVKEGMIRLQGSGQPLSRFTITISAKGLTCSRPRNTSVRPRYSP